MPDHDLAIYSHRSDAAPDNQGRRCSPSGADDLSPIVPPEGKSTCETTSPLPFYLIPTARARCQVLNTRRRYALDSGEPYGVWGGTTPTERFSMVE
ncbi:WhiB family transcriptional regulator [Rhodococcus sp. NPDC060176]|uniref:WhiB family transcriptional regulator n=1 Tax=Rhodococcus sp. NPDC060176 TaxID=3347062 RepID=UPI003661546D